jgi:hypothetical protein
MKARTDYRKHMLYHNLKNSDESRIAKQVVEEQEKMDREGTWLSGVQKSMIEYGIQNTVLEDLKSAWKRKVKEKIRQKTEEIIRENCESKSKSRTVKIGSYDLKDYLKKATIKEAKKILKARLHMLKIPCNYGKGEEGCWLCGEKDVKTEHYYKCSGTRSLQRSWSANEKDLQSTSKSKLIRTAMFLEQVEEMFVPKWQNERILNQFKKYQRK